MFSATISSTSVSSSSLAFSYNLPAPAPSPDDIPPAAEAPSARQLSDEIDARKESSLVWQLMRELLHAADSGASVEMSSSQSLSVAFEQTASTTESGIDYHFSFSATAITSEQWRIETEDGWLEYQSFSYQAIELELDVQTQASDPLQLDLAGNGFSTSGLEHGVPFDIDADGRLDQVSFASGDDRVLALDWNLNGLIDDGRELFGDHGAHASGFAALSALDSDGDGQLTKADPHFADLLLLHLLQDGRQQLQSLQQAGIRALSLAATPQNALSNGGDRLTAEASATREDGQTRALGELWYRHRPLS